MLRWIQHFSDILVAALPKKFGAGRLASPALPGVAAALSGAALARTAPGHCAWVVVSGPAELERVYNDLCALGRGGGIAPLLFPQQDADDPEAAGARAKVIRVMRGIGEGEGADDSQLPQVVVASIPALLQPAPDPDALSKASVTLKAGGSYAFEELVDRLTKAGYERVTDVGAPGQMAVRGGLLDVWPPAAANPWRAEFFDTELESLRTFDPATQRSVDKGDSVWLPPCEESAVAGKVHALDVLPHGAAVIWLDYEGLRGASFGAAAALPDGRPDAAAAGGHQTSWEYLLLAADARDPWLQLFTGDPPPAKTAVIDFPITAVPGLAELGAEEAHHPELLAGARRKLLDGFVAEAEKGADIFLCADTAGTCELLSRELGEDTGVNVQKLSISGGFVLPGCVVAAQPDLYAVRKKNVRRPSFRQEQVGERVEQPSDLEPGDYVVHVDHGIGRFLGSTEIEIDGIRSEVFTIEYADGAKIHVPVSHAHLLSKYIGVSGHPVKLHRLEGKRWTREKADAERAVQDLAAALLETQARRQVVPGFAFNSEPQWMPEFEASFPYQETVDQEKVIADVKRDMAMSRPMDRLVCGDAGYGKTEIAMRAAFIAVMNGKQVAVLAPTTVLAEQHYETFRDRMAAYPVRIDVVNRFHSAAQCEKAFAEAAAGQVDVLIGTHAILSDSLQFKNLGLLIIDEEQRFGVAHKEKLKRVRQTVDVLTLSATPIPRTLYMSMTGARDMSLLQTPPRERVAVETRVARDSDNVLRQAIQQEVQRGGQVYFLYNRVMTIGMMLHRLETLLPEVRIAVAHGQMPTQELSHVMESFEAGEIDVLLCTTIVENGLDIPRANTIIVHRADRFGIADLYQLRGRVGRSSMKGFAWLLMPDHGQIDADARQRIAALRKHSGLGAGFNLALRDLEIRGAGNLLGSAQSGHIAAVGFGLYCQLLRRTIARMKGEKPPMLVDVDMSLDFLDFSPGAIDPATSACLPYSYIDDEGHRMMFHRKLAEANSEKEVQALKRELTDRYGRPPPAVQRLFKLTLLRISAAEKQIGRIETKNGKVYIFRRRERTPVLDNEGYIPLLTGRDSESRLLCIGKVIQKLSSR